MTKLSPNTAGCKLFASTSPIKTFLPTRFVLFFDITFAVFDANKLICPLSPTPLVLKVIRSELPTICEPLSSEGVNVSPALGEISILTVSFLVIHKEAGSRLIFSFLGRSAFLEFSSIEDIDIFITALSGLGILSVSAITSVPILIDWSFLPLTAQSPGKFLTGLFTTCLLKFFTYSLIFFVVAFPSCCVAIDPSIILLLTLFLILSG